MDEIYVANYYVNQNYEIIKHINEEYLSLQANQCGSIIKLSY